jgi:hypothetical protein
VATSVPAYLEGGPCDKTTRDLTPAEADSATLVCKTGLYKAAYPPEQHKGAIVFKYAGKADTGGGAIKAAKAHGGWADVRKSVNRHMPRSLSRSQRDTRAALRALHRAHRVRL